MRLKTYFLYLFLLLCLVFRGSASAQTGMFFDEFGAGYKAASMGQAFTAVADDSTAAYYNPAGLTQIQNVLELTMGYTYAKPELWARYPEHPSLNFSGQPSSHGIFLGIATSLDFMKTIQRFPWFERFAFAVNLWANLPQFTHYYAGPVAIRPHFLRHDMRFQLLALSISLGVKITPWLSIGVGVIPSMDSHSDQDVFQAVNKMDDSDPVKGLRLSIHQTARAFIVPLCGILIKPPFAGLQDKVAVGVSLRTKNAAHHGKGIIKQYIGFEDENGEPLPIAVPYPDHYNINLVSFSPWQLTIGIAARPITGLTLAYDVTYKKFSDYHTYLELVPNPPFHDTWTHRVGVAYAFDPDFNPKCLRQISKIGLRGGYYFEPTPTEDINLSYGIPNNNIYDSDHDVFSAGLSITLGRGKGKHDFDLYFQYHYYHNLSRHAYIDKIYAFMNDLSESGLMAVDIGGNVWVTGGSYTLRF